MAIRRSAVCSFFFFFNDTATTEIYTLSLHDALPISYIAGGLELSEAVSGARAAAERARAMVDGSPLPLALVDGEGRGQRSEEHTSELQSRLHLVCRLLLEKKKKNKACPFLAQ